MTVKLWLMVALINGAVSKPFLFTVPQTLTKFFTSASAASSDPVGNIADLRNAKLQDSLDDDDFFKNSAEQQQNVEEEMKNDASSNPFQTKIQKLNEKIRWLGMLTNFGTSFSDNEVQKGKNDDFDRDFEEDFNEDLVENSGYFYSEPKNKVKNEKQAEGVNPIRLNPTNIGVFFMEVIGSLVGLVYGAAAQLNYHGSSTTASPI